MASEPIFLYPKQAAAFLEVGTTKFYELTKRPDFPKPRKPLGKRPMYLRSGLRGFGKSGQKTYLDYLCLMTEHKNE